MRKTKLMAAGIASAALIGGTLVPATPASAVVTNTGKVY